LQQALPPHRHQGEEVHWQAQELQKSAQMGPPLQPQDGVPHFQEVGQEPLPFLQALHPPCGVPEVLP